MQSSIHLLLLAVLTKETQSFALWNRWPDMQSRQQQRLQRLMQTTTNTSCTLNDLVAGDCSYDEFCLPTEPNSAVACEGLPTSTWTFQVVYFEMCYQSLDDLDGDLVTEDEEDDDVVVGDGYCSTDTALFTFEQQVLTSVQLNQTITAPYQTSIVEEYNVIACTDSDLPDFVFDEISYCNDGCPVTGSIDGITCTGTCTICDNGAGLLNCSNLDPTLVYSCSSELAEDEDDTLYEELFAYLGRQEETPNASSPVVAPTAPSTPAEAPSSTTNTNTTNGGDPVSPVTPSPNTTAASSGGILTSGLPGTAFALLAAHAIVMFSYFH